MRVSGDMFKKTPSLSEYSFSMVGISLTEQTGLARFGFSGGNNTLAFSIRSGKLFDPKGYYVYGYNSGEFISVSGNVSTGFFQYFVNGEEVGYFRKNSFNLEKFFINTTGCSLDIFPSLIGSINLEQIDLEIQPSFYAGTQVTGRVVNNSPFNFNVYSHRISYLGSNKSSLSGSISGEVLSNSSLPFTLYDSGSLEFSTSSEFIISLDSSIGTLNKTVLVTRESNITGDIFVVNDSSFVSSKVEIPFSGESVRSSFSYSRPASGRNVVALNFRKFDRTGLALEKSVSFGFSSSNPTGTATGTGTFVTGYSVEASGFYSQMPIASFSEYGFVTGVGFTTSNLFSLGCGSVIGALFKTASGDGLNGSGNALLRSVVIPLYGSRHFYSITGFSIQNAGTGYAFPPYVDLLTGDIGPDCFDVPRESGNSYIYSPFTGTGVIQKTAAYLYGTPMTGVSVATISGNPYTGFAVTGIRFGNPGSGYSRYSGLTPKVTFTRSAEDLYLGASLDHNIEASGTFIFNQSGDSHSLVNNWKFETGTSLFSLKEISPSLYLGGVTGYSGSVNLLRSDENFYVICSHKQTSLDIAPTVRVSYSIDNNSFSKSVTITGQPSFSTYSGMLNRVTEVDSGLFIEF
jgi:hypothetical protein